MGNLTANTEPEEPAVLAAKRTLRLPAVGRRATILAGCYQAAERLSRHLVRLPKRRGPAP